MISMKLDVVMRDGNTVPVMIGPKVQVEFEREFAMGIAKAFGEDMRMEHVYWLAWRAMRHVQKTSLDFDGWLDQVADVEMDEGEAATPLDSAP